MRKFFASPIGIALILLAIGAAGVYWMLRPTALDHRLADAKTPRRAATAFFHSAVMSPE
jgi:hypothetical protein